MFDIQAEVIFFVKKLSCYWEVAIVYELWQRAVGQELPWAKVACKSLWIYILGEC